MAIGTSSRAHSYYVNKSNGPPNPTTCSPNGVDEIPHSLDFFTNDTSGNTQRNLQRNNLGEFSRKGKNSGTEVETCRNVVQILKKQRSSRSSQFDNQDRMSNVQSLPTIIATNEMG